MLVILGGNPVFTRAGGPALRRRRLEQGPAARPPVASTRTRPSALCHWHVPEAHFLETWSDARAFDGTASDRPAAHRAALRRARPAHEAARGAVGPARAVRLRHRPRLLAGDRLRPARLRGVRGAARSTTASSPAPRFSAEERQASAPAPRSPDGTRSRRSGATASRSSSGPTRRSATAASPTTAGSRSCPSRSRSSPGTTPRCSRPATAARLGARRARTSSSCTLGGRTVDAPVWILPGPGRRARRPSTSATAAPRAGRRRRPAPASTPTRSATSDALWSARRRSRSRRRAATHPLATHAGAPEHGGPRPRPRRRPSTSTAEDPEFAHAMAEAPGAGETHAYPPHACRHGYAWGMAIDLNACIGCNACVVACQAENNIPVVGKEQVAPRPRDALDPRRPLLRAARPTNPRALPPAGPLHALRERARASSSAPSRPRCTAPRAQRHGLQPLRRHALLLEQLPVQGPALQLLPLTRRSSERPSLSMLANPDVTVRSRGVMEKCTYCVQRINDARIDVGDRGPARPRRRDRRPPASRPARPRRSSSATCNDPKSRVAQAARPTPVNYGLLAELNTRPRTTYLAQLRNPEPRAAGAPRLAERSSRNDSVRPEATNPGRRASPGRASVIAPGHTFALGHRQDRARSS